MQRKFDEVPWTMEQTFVGILFILLPWLVFSLLLSLSGSTAPKPKGVTFQQDIVNAVVVLIVGIITEGIFLIAPIYFARQDTRHGSAQGTGQGLVGVGSAQGTTPTRARWRVMLEMLGFRRFNMRRSLNLVIVLFVGIIIADSLYSLVITAFHLHLQTNDRVLLEHGRALPISTYTTLGVAVLIAPICEEIFFRSFVFMGLRNGMPLRVAVVVSALIFAVAHSDPASFIVLFFIGLALAIVRWRTSSIWPGIFLHMLNNGTSAVLIILSLHGMQV